MLAPTYPDNENARRASLQATGLLFSPAEERYDRITRLAKLTLGAPVALISLVADDFQWFKSAQNMDLSEAPRSTSFCGHAILGATALVIEDATQDPRFHDNPLVIGPPFIRFYAGQPLFAPDGHCVGTLCVIDHAPRRFSDEQRAVLKDLAALVETEIQRGQMSETQRTMIREMDELRRKASVDPLTRSWNRGAILELLAAEAARSKRGTPVAVAMIDADHFKAVNDTHGHPAGDAVLAEIAARIRGSLREFDAVGRYGGEEFLAIFSNCGIEDAAAICERIRAAIAAAPIATPAGPVSVSVSIGLAAHDPAHDPADTVAMADGALYRAKKAGRNRVAR